MKNILALAAATLILVAFSNNGESGVQNDGTQAVDSNSGLAGTP